jgi:hypothetical protein
MKQPKKKRTVQRNVRPYVRGVKWREPIDAEALAYALLEIVDVLKEAERAELAQAGQQTIERLDLKTDRDTDHHQAA